MGITRAQIVEVLEAAEKISLSMLPMTVEKFYGDTLELEPLDLADLFPDPDLTGKSAILISHLTLKREEILRDESKLPTFVVYEQLKKFYIAGLSHYYGNNGLITANHPLLFLDRLAHANSLRNELISLKKGHNLEALAAAILAAACVTGDATKGSGDKGIDAIGTNNLVQIDSIFADGEIDEKKLYAGQKVFILASSKAGLGLKGASVKLISPAHIRELIGGWLIQRSESSVWRNLGIQMLSPLQLLLVTTYRLSPESKLECNKLGVQVWGIPEMIFLICRYAPSSIFPAAGTFDINEFKSWWSVKHNNRIQPMASIV